MASPAPIRTDRTDRTDVLAFRNAATERPRPGHEKRHGWTSAAVAGAFGDRAALAGDGRLSDGRRVKHMFYADSTITRPQLQVGGENIFYGHFVEAGWRLRREGGWLWTLQGCRLLR